MWFRIFCASHPSSSPADVCTVSVLLSVQPLLHWFFRPSVAKSHKLSGLTTAIYGLTALEAVSPKSRCSRVGSFRRPGGKDLASRWPPSLCVSSCCLPSVYIFVSKFPLLIRLASHIGLWFTLMILFKLITSVRTLSPKKVPF